MFKKDYFKGWYFKCSTKDKTIAFIPAYHRSNNRETASLQIITDNTAYNIPIDFFKFNQRPLYVKLTNCIFSQEGIKINIKKDKLNIKGNLNFQGLSPIRYDIMGPFKFIPFMQCRHSVYSMKHRVDGQITVNGELFDFQNGIGYIEGDRGSSFPKKYIWTQCSFENGSIMLSVADIPLSGFHFTGIIGVVLSEGKEHRIATYLGADLKYIGDNTVTVGQRGYQLTAKLIKKKSHPLYAPDSGKMSRTIHESVSCTAYYCFSYKENIICEFTSDKASFEFEYI